MEDTLGVTQPIDKVQGRAQLEPVREAQLFVVLECERPAAFGSRHRLGAVDRVTIGRGRSRAAKRSPRGKREELTLRVPDARMSATHARLCRNAGRWFLEDAGSRNGTLVDGVAIERHQLADGDTFEAGYTLFLFRTGVPARADEPRDFDAAMVFPPAPGLLTLSMPYARDLAVLQQLASANVPILIQGESGTGKEVIARAVDRLSNREGGLVAVNCGGIPEALLESELFGCKKGAFSGANEDRPGLVRTADRGTLFLDEIADLPSTSQAALLRVLQEREVRAVGASRAIPVDFRLLSATNRDLDAMVADGDFRRDLFSRVAGHRVHLPPLRERRVDLGLLIGTLLLDLGPQAARDASFTCEAARALLAYDWPHNVRELKNCLKTAAVLADGQPIALEHLPEPLKRPNLVEAAARARLERRAARAGISDAEERHRQELVALFREHRGNVSAVARATGKARQQIHRWIKRYAIDLDDYRES